MGLDTTRNGSGALVRISASVFGFVFAVSSLTRLQFDTMARSGLRAHLSPKCSLHSSAAELLRCLDSLCQNRTWSLRNPAAVQGEIRALDRGLPVEDMRTGTTVIGLLGVFGLLALNLASVGWYGPV